VEQKTAPTKLVKIGNSRGIRIPKEVIDRLNLENGVEIAVADDHLEVRPIRNPREGWAEAFREMHARGDDRMLDEPTPTVFDKEEWEW
jgi:antitoxin MazE